MVFLKKFSTSIWAFAAVITFISSNSTLKAMSSIEELNYEVPEKLLKKKVSQNKEESEPKTFFQKIVRTIKRNPIKTALIATAVIIGTTLGMLLRKKAFEDYKFKKEQQKFKDLPKSIQPPKSEDNVKYNSYKPYNVTLAYLNKSNLGYGLDLRETFYSKEQENDFIYNYTEGIYLLSSSARKF